MIKNIEKFQDENHPQEFYSKN